jgi:hypothetical protein
VTMRNSGRRKSMRWLYLVDTLSCWKFGSEDVGRLSRVRRTYFQFNVVTSRTFPEQPAASRNGVSAVGEFGCVNRTGTTVTTPSCAVHMSRRCTEMAG